jgi:hypothetical protein
MKKLIETFKISFNHVSDISKLKVYNPVGKRGVKVFKERKGMLYKNKTFYEGTYYVYNHRDTAKKFMCVFVPMTVNEGETDVHPIAIDKNLPKVLSRMAYRYNVSKKKYDEQISLPKAKRRPR